MMFFFIFKKAEQHSRHIKSYDHDYSMRPSGKTSCDIAQEVEKSRWYNVSDHFKIQQCQERSIAHEIFPIRFRRRITKKWVYSNCY